MQTKHKASVDFITVYIKEIHALDSWHMDSVVDYNQPTTLDERKLACDKLIDLYNPTMPIVMDNMKDEACSEYAALPERLYIIQEGVVRYVGGNGPHNYNLEEVEEWIKKNA